jgi:hypothetical protein
MLIVETQVHIWGPDTPARPWLAGDDLEWVMGRAICDWLSWPPPI